jgi:formylglycine-generating enzyme required for sulfatase activity
VSTATAWLREPAGERALALPFSVGSTADDAVRVPGAGPDEALQLDWRDALLWASPARGASLSLNGELLAAGTARELRDGDVIAVGAARVRLGRAAVPGGDADAVASLDILHMAGNETLAPLHAARVRTGAEDGEDADLVVAAIDFPGADATGVAGQADPARVRAAASGRRAAAVGLAIAAAALLLAFGVLGRLQRVTLTVDPVDTQVTGSGLVSWRAGDTLFVLPGERRVRGEREGYAALERSITVVPDQPLSLALRLTRLPGILEIDTGGIAAAVTIDGAPAGRVPGELTVPAGERTLTLRAERHLDVVQRVTVEGAGVRQPLQVRFEPSWGQLALSVTTPGAELSVDGGAATALPARLDLPAGVHRLRVSAVGARSWESTVLVRPGEVTTIGPLELGAPDATLVLRPQPAGAGVTVAGAFRGRTPLELALPAGATYEVSLTRSGYRDWQQRVVAVAGARTVLAPSLQPIPVPLTVSGEPAGAELLVDGAVRGRTPATLELLATRYRIEVRQGGLQSFKAEVDLTPALARTVEYRLLPEGRAPGWRPPAETAVTRAGQPLRLVPAGTFMMGSERREQGRQPNESLRLVTLSRRFYLGVREVTNAEFRRFRAGHSAGFVDKRSIDLDAQAVTGVSWVDAVQYCNWLSEQEGLPPAYEQKEGRWSLRMPVTTGYRLPTEAEWEHAARFGGAGRAQRRYEWGDALPVPPGFANLAGSEATAALERRLEGWQDEYQSVAPPARYAAGVLGLYDMTGNVSEWVHDVYASFAGSGAVTDPAGPAAEPGTAGRRVIKGSSWRTASFPALRPAWREGRDSAANDVGFRVARYADE